MQAHIFQTPDEVVLAVAERIAELCRDILSTKSACNIVLSGGNSPKELYKLLASEKFRNDIEWKKLNFFFGDERNVPFNDKDNNGRMANETLFEPLGIKEDHIFYIDTSMPSQEAAANYDELVRTHFAGADEVFDIILLGLGDNAHTASLFPGTEVLEEKTALVKEVFVKEMNVFRITMTAALINKASNIIFLVYGASKAGAVHHVIRGENNYGAYPAQLINPTHGGVEWFMDDAAAAQLQ